VENVEPGHTLAADLAGVALIHGLGAGAPILASLNWITTASEVLYWGDIDRAGLAIVASVRRAGIPARTVLMDEATLDAYPTSCHDTGTQMASHAGGIDIAARTTPSANSKPWATTSPSTRRPDPAAHRGELTSRSSGQTLSYSPSDERDAVAVTAGSKRVLRADRR
jgi:hypothetical protein